MYTVNGNEMKRSPNRLPNALPVRPDYDNGFNGRDTGKAEQPRRLQKSHRRTLCGMKDKMMLAGSTKNRALFVNANAHADRHMDAPTVCLTPPKPRRRRSR
jgi:hypothetical protein